MQVKGDPKSLLKMPQADLDAIRQPLLKPLGHTFKAPNRVALYLFADGSWVVENFADQPATVQLDDVEMEVAATGMAVRLGSERSCQEREVKAR